jgi:hypothetical protein
MSSRRSVGRSISTVAVGFVTLGLLASVGVTRAAADQGSGDRLGCGTYCQNAGVARRSIRRLPYNRRHGTPAPRLPVAAAARLDLTLDPR